MRIINFSKREFLINKINMVAILRIFDDLIDF